MASTEEGNRPGAHGKAVEALVMEELPNRNYRLELASRAVVIGHPASAAKANFVRLRPRDRVLVELTPHDQTRGRITRLLSTERG
jgi:translation initiation factor IF-1